MLVFYSRWGYLVYDLDIDDIPEGMSPCMTEKPQKICSFFELPRDEGLELKYKGVTTTDYLLKWTPFSRQIIA
jgi:hypothetical protein